MTVLGIIVLIFMGACLCWACVEFALLAHDMRKYRKELIEAEEKAALDDKIEEELLEEHERRMGIRI